jgi:hypothetical protein
VARGIEQGEEKGTLEKGGIIIIKVGVRSV